MAVKVRVPIWAQKKVLQITDLKTFLFRLTLSAPHVGQLSLELHSLYRIVDVLS